jgi:antitoxin component HigA of HigAB toxin-antitoxin module
MRINPKLNKQKGGERVYDIDYGGIKKYMDATGLKQKAVAEKVGLTEAQLSLILQQKRKLEASEYANICWAMGVSMKKFLIEK